MEPSPSLAEALLAPRATPRQGKHNSRAQRSGLLAYRQSSAGTGFTSAFVPRRPFVALVPRPRLPPRCGRSDGRCFGVGPT